MADATAAVLLAILPVTARLRAPEWAAVPPRAVDTEDFGEDMAEAPVRLPATSAVDRTTLPVTARPRP